ncbi:MAG: hypothetical protein U0Q18_04505 [Bryobacteraceae bacterium]
MILAGVQLARRLEASEAANGTQCAAAQNIIEPGSGATVLEAAGGWAIYVGAESPLSRAVGLGLRGIVRAAELDAVERFYSQRNAAATVDLCPLADPSLIDLLRDRAYRITEFNHTLVRLPGPVDAGMPGQVAVRQAEAGEERLWAETVGRGFLEKDELTSGELDIGRSIFRIPGVRCYLAYWGGRTAGAAALSFHDGLGMLFADSTVTGFRGLGVQSALIQERLKVAFGAGCDLATASTLPGSTSQRNYERGGFQVVYTKATLVR